MHNIFKKGQFKHLLCSLCFMVNKMLAHVMLTFVASGLDINGVLSHEK